jgi:hypothetical protein
MDEESEKEDVLLPPSNSPPPGLSFGRDVPLTPFDDESKEEGDVVPLQSQEVEGIFGDTLSPSPTIEDGTLVPSPPFYSEPRKPAIDAVMIPDPPPRLPPSKTAKVFERVNTWSDLKEEMSPPVAERNTITSEEENNNMTVVKDVDQLFSPKKRNSSKTLKEMKKKVLAMVQNEHEIQMQELRTKHTQEVTDLRRRLLESRLELDRMDRHFEKMTLEYESKSKEVIAAKFGREREHENALLVSQAHRKARQLLNEEIARRNRVEKILEATKDAMKKQKHDHKIMETRYMKLRKASRHFDYKEKKYQIRIRHLEIERRDHMKRIYEANDVQEKMNRRIEDLENELISLRQRLEREHRDSRFRIQDVVVVAATEKKDSIFVTKEEDSMLVTTKEEKDSITNEGASKKVLVKVEDGVVNVKEAEAVKNQREEKMEEEEKIATQQEEEKVTTQQHQEKEQAIKALEPCLATALRGWWRNVERKKKIPNARPRLSKSFC